MTRNQAACSDGRYVVFCVSLLSKKTSSDFDLFPYSHIGYHTPISVVGNRTELIDISDNNLCSVIGYSESKILLTDYTISNIGG